MIKYLYFFNIIVVLTMFSMPASFSLGIKIEKKPMKPYSNIDIPDGEYLHYGNYTAGEKYGDTYMVIRKVPNGGGGWYYKVYKQDIHISDGKRLPKEYTNWESSFMVDPKLGSVLEAYEKTSSGEDDKNRLLYYRYKFYSDRGYVDFVLKTITNNSVNEKKYHIKVNTDFPSWDNFSMYYALSFLNDKGGGILYMVNPFFFKDPLPFYFKRISTETVRTKAGTFKTFKATMIIADTFLGSLMEPILKGSAMWAEDSDRRFLIKAEMAGYTAFLEEISNTGQDLTE